MIDSKKSSTNHCLDIFISYAQEDSEERAKELYNQLCLLAPKRKSKFFLSSQDGCIPPGIRWPDTIKNALEASTTIAVLLSVKTETAYYQYEEILRAIKLFREGNCRHLIPILLDNNVKIPLGLDQLQAFKLGTMEEIAKQLLNLEAHQHRHFQTKYKQGVIVHLKVINYDKLPSPDQEKIEDFLQIEFSRFDLLVHPMTILDFRGEDCTFFLEWNNKVRPRTLQLKALLFAFHLQYKIKKAIPQLEDSGLLPLRIALIIDWEGQGRLIPFSCHEALQHSLIGPAVNWTRSLMAFSNRANIYISDRVYAELGWHGKNNEAVLTELQENAPVHGEFWHPDITSSFSFKRFSFEHPGRGITLYAVNLSVEKEKETFLGDTGEPQERVWIEYRSPKSVPLKENTFVKKLISFNSICIIGVTNENLVKFLEFAYKSRKEKGMKPWDELLIIFPAQETLGRIVDQHDMEKDKDYEKILDERTKNWNQGKRSVYSFLMGETVATRWECLEYAGNLPLIGQRFGGGKESSIRVAPILPGVDFKESYYMEVFKGSEVFAQLNDSFDVVIRKARPMVEWLVCGTLANQNFILETLINRKQLSECKKKQVFEPCYLVTLVILYIPTGGTILTALQKRTPFNSTDSFGLFSNISGWVTDMDILKKFSVNASVKYIDSNYNYEKSPPDNQDALFALVDEIGQDALKFKQTIPPDQLEMIWREAARREVYEELGLQIEQSDLVFRPHNRIVGRPFGNLLFGIFSLKLTTEKLDYINRYRPRSELQKFSLEKIKDMKKNEQLNIFLQNHFDVFEAIYTELSIK